MSQTDKDYAELRLTLMAHQAVLCAILATHENKAALSASITLAVDQVQSQLLSSRLDDQTLALFDAAIQRILAKAGIAPASR